MAIILNLLQARVIRGGVAVALDVSESYWRMLGLANRRRGSANLRRGYRGGAVVRTGRIYKENKPTRGYLQMQTPRMQLCLVTGKAIVQRQLLSATPKATAEVCGEKRLSLKKYSVDDCRLTIM
jgi:hypothetical protein